MRRRALYIVGLLLALAVIVVVASVWARTPERDVRCDKEKRAELRARGEEYSCLVQIPGHDRGH